MKHLPPSTQLEYNRLLKRMHQLERQKLLKGQREQPKKAGMPVSAIGRAGSTVKTRPSPIKAPPPPPLTEKNSLNDNVTVINRLNFEPKQKSAKTVVATGGGEAVPNQAARVTRDPDEGGRVTLKDRLKSLTDEQSKMLLDVQQRKVANKRWKTVSGSRRLLNHHWLMIVAHLGHLVPPLTSFPPCSHSRKVVAQSLDQFLGTLEESMAANRQQIQLELELRRLRRMLRQKEHQLGEQRKLCDQTLHERLQGQYKQMIVARQSLAMATSQCVDITEAMANGQEDTKPIRCVFGACVLGSSLTFSALFFGTD